MKYARETMELLAAYPGRPFRMVGIVNYICGKSADTKRRKSVTESVRRVLQSLRETGSIEVVEATCNGAPAVYSWKVSKPPHEALAEHRA